MRVPVRLQREIARIHFRDPAISARQIDRMIGVSYTSVGKLRKQLVESGKQWSELEPLDDDEWQRVLNTHNKTVSSKKPAPNWSEVQAKRLATGMTLEDLWDDFRADHPDGLGYSQFTNGLRVWLEKQTLVLRNVHFAGDKAFEDFAGDKILIEQDDGTVRPANLFVSALGCSHYVFAELTWTQGEIDWAECQAKAFNFFGGVTNWVICDNLKAAVIKRAGDRIEINETFRDCLRHFGSDVLPIRPRSPRHNAKGEVAVQLVQRWIVPKLRSCTFRSLEEARSELQRLLKVFNERKMRRSGRSRLELFLELDSPKLKPLPPVPYVPKTFVWGVRVGQDYRFTFRGSTYTVPHHYAGSLVDLRVTSSVLEVFQKRRHVWTHALSAEKGMATIVESHHPPAFRKVLQAEPRALLQWANGAGPATEQIVKWHLTERNDGANGIKVAKKLRHLADIHGEARIESVCRYAVARNARSLTRLVSILDRQADLRVAADEDPLGPPAPLHHDNLRPDDYFKKDE